MKSILTVCVGNICRSPMAEGLLKCKLPNLRIASAGIGALVGHSADSIAQMLMAEKNIDISGHVAQQISQLLCRQADLILVMESDHRRHLEAIYPFARGKIFRLAENLKKDIPDPYKLGETEFKKSLALIEAGACAWVERISKIRHLEHQAT